MLSIKEIAEKESLDPSTISKRIQKLGIEPQKVKRPEANFRQEKCLTEEQYQDYQQRLKNAGYLPEEEDDVAYNLKQAIYFLEKALDAYKQNV